MQNAAHLVSPIAALQSSSSNADAELNPVVGVSAAWRKLLLQAQMAAPHLQVAAIEGECGTGKKTLARYVFSRSPLAATIFQRHDAREWLAMKPDSARLAGILYLDRVDLLIPPAQSLLLEFLKNLQDRSTGRSVMLASSHIPLRQMASQGLLLPDLAFRLTAIRFAIPPLRERREDITPLAQYMLDRLCQRYQLRPISLAPEALAALLRHNWPGNVRELASVLEAALLQAENGILRPADLALCDSPPTLFRRDEVPPPTRTGDLTLDAVIRRHIQYVLDLNCGNKLRTARQLAISRSTLYRLLANKPFLSH